jgi:glycosyltransferase involved in cell wall biosynthesis
VRVAFDATALITGRTGIARYIEELTVALRATGVDVRRFAVGRAAEQVPPDVRHLRVPLRVVQRAWTLVRTPTAERLAGPADLVHATSLVPPPTRLPIVSTVHDLAALEHPALHPRRSLDQLRAQVDALDRAAVVLSVSHATAAALAARGFSADRIVVTPLGVTPPRDEGLAPPPGPYLLAVGGLVPRKGLDTLVAAMAHVPADVRLMLAGPSGEAEPELRQRAAAPGVSGRVKFLGAVDEAQLAALYRGALALCFPSVSEGFGLPVVEAMAAGVPVIASDIDVVREVAGDAAVKVPVGDVSAWAHEIGRLVDDAGERRRLIDLGRRRATVFTWEATARGTLAAYERAVASRS